MELELKFKSVAWKWITNVFLVMFAIIFALEIIFCVFVRSYYVSKAQNMAEEYAQVFITPLSNTQTESFETTAREYCEGFEYKDKMEIQVLDKEGKMLISTTGFAQAPASMPDYDRAVTAGSNGVWTGKSTVGESVLCKTTLLKNGSGEIFGAVRWVISLRNVNTQSLFVIAIVIAVGLALLSVIIISGMYFINSIVRPIRNVSSLARKIAMGDFENTIEPHANNEIGELCDSINYMASELKRAENLKNDFISSVSHELRTPLTAIRGWAETAKLSIGFDEETVEKGLDVVIKESERLHGLVEALLDFSRMQSGHLPIDLAEFELGAVLSESADMYKELAKKQNVELVYMPMSDTTLCYGDSNRIKQVFINVIDNALKYNQPGGQILIESRIDDGCVQVSISDTGVGIAPQDLDRVKEKFYKANKQVRGSGIGLAVADEIIKQHNGLILVDSTEGVGTTVTIVLPVITKTEGETDEL
jgi:signal transduction histidine kinase